MYDGYVKEVIIVALLDLGSFRNFLLSLELIINSRSYVRPPGMMINPSLSSIYPVMSNNSACNIYELYAIT